MSSIDEMLSQLRASVEVRGQQWLQEKVQTMLQGPGETPAMAPPTSPRRLRRTRPPARLSPEEAPRAQRRRRSPSKDPPSQAAGRSASSRQSRGRRNPVVRRDSRRRQQAASPPFQDGSRRSKPGSASQHDVDALEMGLQSAGPLQGGDGGLDPLGPVSGATDLSQSPAPSSSSSDEARRAQSSVGAVSSANEVPMVGLQRDLVMAPKPDTEQTTDGVTALVQSGECASVSSSPVPLLPTQGGELHSGEVGRGLMDFMGVLGHLLRSVQPSAAPSPASVSVPGLPPPFLASGSSGASSLSGGAAISSVAQEGESGGQSGQEKENEECGKKEKGEAMQRFYDSEAVYVCLEGPLGAHLEQEVRDKIWKGEYVEIFSLLPLERFNLDRAKKDESKKEEEEERRYRLIPRTFSNWLQAFTILASVIGEKAPENCSALFCYMDVIGEAYRVYGGQAWLRYDEQFRQRKALRPSIRWDHKDISLWLKLMVPVRTGQSFPAGAGGTNGAGRSASTLKGLCFAYNEGTCKYGSKCKFKHECSYCGGGSHGESRCFKRGKGKGGNAVGKGLKESSPDIFGGGVPGVEDKRLWGYDWGDEPGRFWTGF
ncbi:uncharacterized protein RB166_012822 [Leptodactylus fuscus]|uniref:uncharacterized protein LOC142209547 n=1 Tax=Leptodactylus fuscus TaxID=238119 RepID=UPI003F4EEEE8